MFDLFGDEELSYTDIHMNVLKLREDVEALDDDSLVDELREVQYRTIGKTSEMIEHLIFKNYSDEDLTEEERQFLKDIYVIYYSSYAILVDEDEEEDED